jgi:hypothetical protein
MSDLQKFSEAILSCIDGEKGYYVGTMGSDEIKLIKAYIYDQYLGRILYQSPQESHHFAAAPIHQYHTFDNLVEHSQLWPKRARILGPAALNQIKSLDFFQMLTQSLGIQRISGEEKSGWEEAYWRIVRPGSSDIGNFHADKWFWDLGHGPKDTATRRLKIWIAVETVPGESGLRVIPSSHKKSDWMYHGQVDHTGIAKPIFDEELSKLNIVNVQTKPGDFIIFHDELIHSGMPNNSKRTRVSLEATLLVDK